MLNDAHIRHDILSHAYAELQAEYRKIKSSSSSSSNLDARNAHLHCHQLSPSLTTAFSIIPETTVPVDMGGALVDGGTCMNGLNIANNFEFYLLPDVGGYCL